MTNEGSNFSTPDRCGQRRHLCHAKRDLGCEADGISATRAWIFEHWRDEKVLMLDDDMYFYKRPKMQETKLKRTKPKHLRAMIRQIRGLLRQYPMVGISASTLPEAERLEVRGW